MQLLVSIRSAGEVEPAVLGGADILDAKDPGRGSLGPVAPDALGKILQRVPPNRDFSIALGDLACAEDVAAAITSLDLPERPGRTFLKLGFAGVPSPETVHQLISTAVATATSQAARAGVVAVAYADSGRAQAVGPEQVTELAYRAGAAGVLVDTHTKDGTGLLRWLNPAALQEWVSQSKVLGLLTGLAGELGLADMATIAWIGPDVVGVRGAACAAGRRGWVVAERVQELRHGLRLPPVGETRESGAISSAHSRVNSRRIKT